MTEPTYEYLVWSNKHGGWWRQNRHGYTTIIQWAGIFSEREAHQILADFSRGAQVQAHDELDVYPDQIVPTLALIPIPDGHPGGPNCPPVASFGRAIQAD